MKIYMWLNAVLAVFSAWKHVVSGDKTMRESLNLGEVCVYTIHTYDTDSKYFNKANNELLG